jgi:hypothetical protein
MGDQLVKMVNFTTYGMAGIGIATAIGFVFALSILSNNNTTLTVPDSGPPTAGPQSLSTLQQKSQSHGEEDNAADNAPTPDQGTSAKMQATINNESNMDNQQAMTDAQPTLTSLIALNSSREIIGEVVPQMEFKFGSTVFIQANFANNNEADIAQRTITMDLRSQNGEDLRDENVVSFNGGIARDANIALEFYWQPDRTGDFTIIVFSTTHGDLNSTQPVKPVAEIPVRVIE